MRPQCLQSMRYLPPRSYASSNSGLCCCFKISWTLGIHLSVYGALQEAIRGTIFWRHTAALSWESARRSSPARHSRSDISHNFPHAFSPDTLVRKIPSSAAYTVRVLCWTPATPTKDTAISNQSAQFDCASDTAAFSQCMPLSFNLDWI